MATWVTFESGKQGCVEMPDDVYGIRAIEQREAKFKELCEQLGGEPVVKMESLPYPASPRLNNPNGWPSFCMSPRTCAGRSSCPRSYACSE